MKRILMTLTSLFISVPVFAAPSFNLPSRFYTGIYGGYTNVSGAYKNDGQVAQGRMMLGIHLARYNPVTVGVEAGLQSGNEMRLQTSAALIESAGGLPVQTTLKPLLDLLIAVQGKFSENYPVIGILKAGVAYRQLQFVDRSSPRDTLRKVNPELQLGLGVNITPRTLFTAFYQGIYSGSTAGAALNSVNDVTISHIPTQQAIFIGLESSVGEAMS